MPWPDKPLLYGRTITHVHSNTAIRSYTTMNKVASTQIYLPVSSSVCFERLRMFGWISCSPVVTLLSGLPAHIIPFVAMIFLHESHVDLMSRNDPSSAMMLGAARGMLSHVCLLMSTSFECVSLFPPCFGPVSGSLLSWTLLIDILVLSIVPHRV